MLKSFSMIVLGLLTVTCSAALQTSQLQLDKNMTVRNLAKKGDWRQASLQFYMNIGQKGISAEMGEPQVSEVDGSMQLLWTTPEYRWQVTLSPRGKMIEAVSELTSLATQELWLEPGMRLTVAKDDTFSRFWSGFGHSAEIGKEPLHRTGIKGEMEKHVGASTMPFPVSGIFGSKDSLFIGGVPFDPVSYTAGSWDPLTKLLTYSLRVVVSPQQTVTFRQTLGRASATYGAQEAIVQQYYEAYPECWAVIMGQDNPYIWGEHGQYINWWLKPEPELSRRLGVTLEWTYCPYKRSGDMLCREELWDYKPYSPFRPNKTEMGKRFDMAKTSREDYLRHRQEFFRRDGRRYGLMFYNTTSGTWCEINLAKKLYPDAITHDKDVSYILNTWSTHHDQEIRVFPWQTSFGKVFESDMVTLTKELDLPGFALDCAYGGAYYRGPAVEKPLPGRAWDDKGKFIDQNVAINHQVDFIHNIIKEPKNRRLSAFINGYLKGDYVMVEAPYMNTGKYKRWMPLLRWYIGPRPGCAHGHGYMLKEAIPDWHSRSPEELRDMIGKLSDYVIMNQFKYGLGTTYPTQYGFPQQLYIQQEQHELMRAGWQAEIPIVLEDGMRVPYLARYGRGPNAYFFLGNSGTEVVKGKVRFDNQAVSDDGLSILYALKMRNNSETTNLLDGNFTQVETVLPSRVPVIYEALAGIRKPAEDFSCEIDVNKQLNEQRYHLRFKNQQTFSSPLFVRDIRNFQLTGITLNGQDVKAGVDVQIKPNSVLEFRYSSQIFNNSAQEILAFPFTDAKNRTAFSVQINSENGRELAQRFNEYFDFCRSKELIAADSSQVMIEKVDKPVPAAGVVTLLIGEDSEKISVTPNKGLVITAHNAESANLMITELLKVMDLRYEYVFPFRMVSGLNWEMIRHFQMMNKAFPYQKYFEAQ